MFGESETGVVNLINHVPRYSPIFNDIKITNIKYFPFPGVDNNLHILVIYRICIRDWYNTRKSPDSTLSYSLEGSRRVYVHMWNVVRDNIETYFFTSLICIGKFQFLTTTFLPKTNHGTSATLFYHYVKNRQTTHIHNEPNDDIHKQNNWIEIFSTQRFLRKIHMGAERSY
ncbi:hypothetical protein RF11_13620 [Thelohanellus kitauei]|uniref:Uncharacterized protein n=1 Tax=Thelohanellus kitauei TaxID=669202 RepID=A0A0C2MGT3_THEKT|nr:hypothetical protein RF11_13620 [Thelohanellus kitauei]